MKINTKFNIEEKVYITELKLWGRAISINFSGRLEYYVRFFKDGDAKFSYFIEEELNNREIGEQNIGFLK